MPLDFPSAPTQGQSWTGTNGVEYIWDGVKWVAAGVPGGTGTYLPLSGGTMSGPIGDLVASETSDNPNATTSTALFTGTGAYGTQEWFQDTSLWVPNGGLWVYNPNPYGAGGLAGTANFGMGTRSGSMPQINGAFTDVGNKPVALATYPGRDKATFCTIAADTGPQLVLNNVTYDATHIYPATPLTPAQVAAIEVDMFIDTNHTPKFAGLVTAVAADGSSITVNGWFQTVGYYVSGATLSTTTGGYQVGDICTVMNPAPNAAPAQIRVTSVDGSGNITGVAVAYGGSYTSPPVTAQGSQLYGGHGGGAWVTLTTTQVAGNSNSGQNPQTVPLHGSNPPAFKAYVNPSDKTWNRDSIAVVGANYAGNWTAPWIEGGGVTAATGEEMDVANYTGVYYPGQDGIIGDFPTLRAMEISNPGNAPNSIGILISGNWYNGFVTYGQSSVETAFGAYDATNGWMAQITAGGTVHLGGQRAVSPATPIIWHTTGSTQIDAQIEATGGVAGTANQATLQLTAGVVQVSGGPLQIMNGNFYVNGMIEAVHNSSGATFTSQLGTFITNNLNTGVGETDFINTFVGNGGWGWWQLRSTNALVQVANLGPYGNFDLMIGTGITYGGVGGANAIAFTWTASAITGWVDGTSVGPMVMQSAMDDALARIAGLEARLTGAGL